MKTAACCFIVGWLLAGDPAWGHDIYEALTHGSECACDNIERRCEPVNVTVASNRPNDYYLPATDEYFPRSMVRQSPDERFHRCTDRLNMQWHSRYGVRRNPGHGVVEGPEGWVEVPNNLTRDGKPRTRCLWAPNVGW